MLDLRGVGVSEQLMAKRLIRELDFLDRILGKVTLGDVPKEGYSAGSVQYVGHIQSASVHVVRKLEQLLGDLHSWIVTPPIVNMCRWFRLMIIT